MTQAIPRDFDAIVIGSGMTGGWAAKELTELGLRTLVLEAGRLVVPSQDYSEHRPVWDMPFRGLGDRSRLRILALLRETDVPVPDARVAECWDDAVQRERALASLLDDGLVVRAGQGALALP